MRCKVLDRLPSWLRHLLIVAGATAGGSLATAVVSAGGVTTLAWVDTLTSALNAATVATATAAAALWFTPLTTQYGVGAPKAAKADDDEELND
jgi:hypothetical protein